MTYEPLSPQGSHDLRAPRTAMHLWLMHPLQWHTHDLSGLGLSVEAVGKAQQDKLRRGPGYEG